MTPVGEPKDLGARNDSCRWPQGLRSKMYCFFSRQI